MGAPGDDDGGSDRGAMWVLFMKTNGKVDDQVKISSTQGKFDQNMDNGDAFGSSLAGLGNLDNDRSNDIAAGAPLDDDGKTDAGAVYILFMERKEDKKRTDIFSPN